MDINCFLIVPDGTTHRYISMQGHNPDACYGHPHRASIRLADGLVTDNESSWHMRTPHTMPPSSFPVKCDACDYMFQWDNDTYILDIRHVWVRNDSREFCCDSIHSAPPGAMWFADWMEDMLNYCGPDGKCLCVMTPGGIWHIDSRASNCGLPEDNIHKCWVRHGDAPDITVDKAGNTCNAGAGSISLPGYHGFLRAGKLVDA